MATNILKIFNKSTNSWESVSGVGLGADPSSSTGTVDLTNYYKKNETYSKSEIDTKVSSAGNFDASQYYPKTEVYSKSETDSKIPDVSILAKKSETYNKSEVDTKVNFVHQNTIAVANETMLDNIKLVKKSIAECANKESIYDKNQIDSKLNNYLNKDFSIYKMKLPHNFITSLNFQYASSSAEYTTEIPQKFNGINLKEREYIFLDADVFYFGTQGVTVNNKTFNVPDMGHSSGYNFKIKKTELKDNNFYTYLYMILISDDGQDKKAFKFTLKQSFSFVGENVNITMTLMAPKVSSKVYNDFILNEENIDENTFTEFETSESFEIGTPYENYVNLLVNLKDINEIKELKEEISFGEIGVSQEINVPNLKSLKNELTINIPLNTKIPDREYSLEDALNFIDLEKHFDLRLLNYTGSAAFESKITLERIEDKGNFLNFYINTTGYDQVTIYRIPIEKTARKENNNLKITIKIEDVIYKNKFSFNKLYTNLIDFDENYEIDSDLDDIKVFFDGSLRCDMLYFFTRKEVIIDEILKRKSSGNVDLSNYYNKSEVDSKITSSGSFNSSLYYNKSEIDNNFVTKEKIHDDYYAKSETEQKISEKATEIDSKITEIKSQLTDYYRQSETYSKAEVDTKIKEMKDNKNHDFDDIYTKYDLLPLEITENTDVKKHPKIKRLNSNEEGITDNYGYNSRTIESCPEVLAQQDIRITNSAFPEQFLNDPLVFWNKDIKSKESNTQFILNDKDNIYIKFYKDIRLSESEYTAEYFKNNVFLLNDQRCRKLNFVFYNNDTLSVICDSYFATVQEVSSKKYKISYESEGFKYDATSQELEFYIDLNNIEVLNNEGENTFYLKIKNSPENKTLERKYLFFPLPDLYIDSKDNTDYEKIKNELDTYTSKLLRKQNNMNPYVPMTMIYDQTDGETETTNKNITSDRTKLTDITFALNPLENDFDYRDESIIYKVLRVNLGLYFDNDNTKLLNYFKTNFNITTFGYTTLMLEDSYLCLNLKSVDNNNYGFGRKFKGNVTLDSKVFTFEFDYGITIKENRESKLDFPYKDYKYTSVYFVLQSPIKISGNGISKTLKIRDVVDLGFQIPYSSTLTDTNYLGICMYGDFRMNDIWLKYNFFLRNNDITQSMSLHPNQYIKYQEKTFGDKLSEKAINVDNVIVKRDLSSFSPSNISSTIRTNILDGAGILLPSENWKSVQNFQTVSDTRDFQIFVNYENPKSGVLVNDEKRCVSGVILIDVRHDNGLEITTLSGQEIIKINEFDKTSFKRGINIISYFCVEKTIYITKVK